MGMIVLSMGMIVPSIMLAQQILAIIVAVRRSHHGMDVVARGRVVIVDNAGDVIEFNKDYGTQDPIIERTYIIEWPDPRENSLTQMPLDFVVADFGVAGPDLIGIER